jgi:hypothetical protein
MWEGRGEVAKEEEGKEMAREVGTLVNTVHFLLWK